MLRGTKSRKPTNSQSDMAARRGVNIMARRLIPIPVLFYVAQTHKRIYWSPPPSSPFALLRPAEPTIVANVVSIRQGPFFLSGRLAPTSYHTNKTRLAEAPFGPASDDNGPGSETQPHDRFRYSDGLLRFSPTFWFPPARPISRALSLLKFGAQIKQTAKYGREPDANRLLKVRRPWPKPPESKESGRPPRVNGDGILRYRLGWEPILAVEVGIVRTVVAQLGKESPSTEGGEREGTKGGDGSVTVL
ncbi:hypothetical protein THAOC_23223, partial [Thalassiosira oceanica]